MKKIAIILSGCGVYDGSEIHETVLALLAIRQEKASYTIFAPDVSQPITVDHFSNTKTHEPRLVLSEAARIARGDIQALSHLDVNSFDALFLPGGFGVCTTLSTFSENEEHFEVLPELKNILEVFHEKKKPIGATCIAPVLLAKTFQDKVSLKLTLGTDSHYQNVLTKLGMKPIVCTSDSFVSDDAEKVYTSPAYMEKVDIATIQKGISLLVKKITTKD